MKSSRFILMTENSSKDHRSHSFTKKEFYLDHPPWILCTVLNSLSFQSGTPWVNHRPWIEPLRKVVGLHLPKIWKLKIISACWMVKYLSTQIHFRSRANKSSTHSLLKTSKNKINHVFNGDPMQTSAYVDLIYRLMSKSGPVKWYFSNLWSWVRDGWMVHHRPLDLVT